MTSQVFYRKWRPQTLAEVVGQEQVTRTLLNALAGKSLSHAYLFCGPRGTGKTSTGRILAKAVNCLNNEGKGEPCNTCHICEAITEGSALDIIEVDAASNRGIDEIRDLREKVSYAPNQTRYKVYIIDEVHMLTKEAANALLKTLEEPPPHVIFILATTEAHKVLPTILSRCQRFDFRRISQDAVVAKLTEICYAEGIKLAPEGLRLIAKATTGSLRDAENMLQQMTTYYGTEIGLQQVQQTLGITGDWRSKELVRQIINGDVAGGITTINSVHHDGVDLRQFNRELMEYLRALLLMKTGSTESVDLTADDLKEIKEVAATASMEQILKAIKLFGQLELSLDSYSTLPLELALVDCTMPSKEGPAPQPAMPGEKQTVKKAAPPPQVTAKAPAGELAETSAEPVPASQAPPEAAAPQPEVKATAPGPADEPHAEKEAKAAQPEETPAATPETPPTAGSEFEQLAKNWRNMIVQAKDGIGRTPAAALLRSATLKSIEGNTVIVSFKYPLHKENMEKMENQRIAEKIISDFLNRSCIVRCIHEAQNDHLLQAALKMGAQIDTTEEQ